MSAEPVTHPDVTALLGQEDVKRGQRVRLAMTACHGIEGFLDVHGMAEVIAQRTVDTAIQAYNVFNCDTIGRN